MNILIGETTAAWAKSMNLFTRYTPQTTSTNDSAKKEAFTDDLIENEFALYVTEQQTQGRGRHNRTWTDPGKGKSLLSSWSFQIERPPLPTITALAGLATYTSAIPTWPFLPWSLKAPNDLYLGPQKVAGLLVETVSQGHEHRLIVGLGFNVLQAPEDVGTATSLLQHLSSETPLLGEDWISFLERLFFEFSRLIPLASEDLNSTQTHSLIHILNQFPGLDKKYSNAQELKEALWR